MGLGGGEPPAGYLLRVTIPGDPVGKGRPRLSTRGGHARAYTPAKTRTWEAGAALVLRNAHRGYPIAAPVRVVVNAVQERPKRLVPRSAGGSFPVSQVCPLNRMLRPTKPDADNVLKAVLDALVLAGVILDDVQAVEVVARSLYGYLGETSRVEVEVTVLTGGVS